MEFFIDRRSDSCPRVPIESKIIVEFDGLSEPIAADCVDLSSGGISLRSPLLPDEGTAVFCSFERVVEEADFGAWGRVVWVQNQGKRSSEFGVCFDDFDPEVEAQISELLSQNSLSAQSTPETNPTTSVKLLFDGSASPVEARVVDRSGDQVIFVQDLELLRLKRGLLACESHENSYRGRIESVDLRLDGQVPRLFITARQDPVDREQTVEQSNAPKVSSQALQASESPIEQQRYDDEIQWNAGSEPELESEQSKTIENRPASSQTERPRRSDDHNTLFTLPEDGIKQERIDSDLSDERDIVSAPFATGIKCLVTIAAALWVRLRQLLVQLFDRVHKWMRERGMCLIERAIERIRHGLIPSIKAFAQKLLTIRLLRRKRRTTAVPSSLTASTHRSGGLGERGLWPRLVRPLLLPSLAIGGVALAVYGFIPRTDSGRVPLHRPVGIEKTDQPSKPSLPEDADHKRAAPTAVDSQNPTTADSESDPNAVSTLVKTERDGTTFGYASSEQTVRTNSLRRSSTAATISEDNRSLNPSGSTLETTTSRRPTFGSRKNIAGHSYTLRMSNEITELRGIPDQGGFTVIIPGSLSFDRAGPIASAHPLVVRSTILNKGDHSALTVRFARGKSPAYRVIAKGSSLEITIAEKS